MKDAPYTLDQFIFHNVRDNEDNAFAALKQKGIQNGEKIYFQAHGNQTHCETHLSAGFERNLTAEQLALKFWEQAGLKDTVAAHVHQCVVQPVRDRHADLNLRIRFLSCLTGRELEQNTSERTYFSSKTADSFVEDFNKAIMRRAGAFIKTLSAEHPNKFPGSSFSFSLETKAPRGWNVTLQDGSNLSYYTATKKEAGADRQFRRNFDLISSKNVIPSAIQPYVLPDDKKSTRIISVMRKYASDATVHPECTKRVSK